jgi:hypothetical protein
VRERREERLGEDALNLGRVQGPRVFVSLLKLGNGREWDEIDSPVDGTINVVLRSSTW